MSRVVYLSAHLDDAVLSCGGLIYDQIQGGKKVEVWTFFPADREGQPPEGFQKRREEDKNATGLLGARFCHFNFQDAFDRGYENVTESLRPNDDDLIISIANTIKADLNPDDKVMCPLAVGQHVDHVVLRKACEHLDLPDIRYFVDFPYVEYLPSALEPASKKMLRYAVNISTFGLQNWKDAVCEYKSQNLYETQDITRQKLDEYWLKAQGIFIYQKQTPEHIFRSYYYHNQWGDANTVSGPGSSLEETEVIRSELPKLIFAYKIKSILDIPCGDFFWMRLVDLPLVYNGMDIVPEIVRLNKERYGKLTRHFWTGNLLDSNLLPAYDLLLCRDGLPHFSEKDVLKAIVNIKASNCKYILTTTFPHAERMNIETGEWRPLNLQQQPYNFPEPLEIVDENSPNKLYGPKCIALWKISDL